MCSINNNLEWGVTDLRLAFPKAEAMQFKDFNFRYTAGEKILLLGPSGCGKSTLLQVLSGLIPEHIPAAMKAGRHDIPDNWGFIFQDPETQFCMPYVDEDIAFVLENRRVPRQEMPALITHYLQLVGLEFANPHQLIHNLSGGMKQRLAIAGVLALEPDVLFLDEPTALLDPQGTVDFWNILGNVSIGRTLVIVEHKINHVLELVDRVVLFDQAGNSIADGAREDVLSEQKTYLQANGIWYPGAWEDQMPVQRIPKQAGNRSPIFELNCFSVLRGKYTAFTVSQLSVFKGEWVTIIGHNGAGKSSLLEGLAGLLRTKGTIHWAFSHPEDEIGFVFQNPEFQFVTDRVEDELAFSLQVRAVDADRIRRRVDELLTLFSLTAYRDQHPFQLSVGQKRRLSVATALVTHPRVLLLDEPTFGQDAKNTFLLLRRLRRLQEQGTTVIMVTHELEVVRRFATRVVEIDGGHVITDCAASDWEGSADGTRHDSTGQLASKN